MNSCPLVIVDPCAEVLHLTALSVHRPKSVFRSPRLREAGEIAILWTNETLSAGLPKCLITTVKTDRALRKSRTRTRRLRSSEKMWRLIPCVRLESVLPQGGRAPGEANRAPFWVEHWSIGANPCPKGTNHAPPMIQSMAIVPAPLSRE